MNILLENTNPLSIFSQTIIQNDLIGHKKQTDEIDNINNFNHFSPNFSAGSLKAISPFFNPTPNIQTAGGFSNFFMFNNNLVGTPLKSMNNTSNLNFQGLGNSSTNNMVTSPKNTNQDELNKNFNNVEENVTAKISAQTNTNPPHLNLNNQISHPTIIIPKINFREDTNLVGIPTPGRNLGFYSWVIHGSPVLHNNPLVGNFKTHNRKNATKKRKNFKKMDEI